MNNQLLDYNQYILNYHRATAYPISRPIYLQFGRKSRNKRNNKKSRKSNNKKSRKSNSKNSRKSCKKRLQDKIKINMKEWKAGKYSSQKQALAVSYSQIKKWYPKCKFLKN